MALFSNEIIGIKTFIHHTPEIAAWTIDVRAFAGQAAATSEWGTERRHAGQLLSDALNSAIPQIYDVFTEDGQEKRILNAAETEAAKEKLQKIKTAFERWVWTDPERADRLTFGETRTELELQPSGLYKPVTRFASPSLRIIRTRIADACNLMDHGEANISRRPSQTSPGVRSQMAIAQSAPRGGGPARTRLTALGGLRADMKKALEIPRASSLFLRANAPEFFSNPCRPCRRQAWPALPSSDVR